MKNLLQAFIIAFLILQSSSLCAADIAGLYKGRTATITVSPATGDVWQIQCEIFYGKESGGKYSYLSSKAETVEWTDKYTHIYKCAPVKKVSNKNVYHVSIKSAVDCPGLVGDMMGEINTKYSYLDIHSRTGLAELSFPKPVFLDMSNAQRGFDECARLAGEYKKIK